jgi:hypothetical protein
MSATGFQVEERDGENYRFAVRSALHRDLLQEGERTSAHPKTPNGHQ